MEEIDTLIDEIIHYRPTLDTYMDIEVNRSNVWTCSKIILFAEHFSHRSCYACSDWEELKQYLEKACGKIPELNITYI